MSIENPNLLLIKGLSGIYLNRSLPEENGRLNSLVSNIMEKVKLPVDTLGEGGEGDISRALHNTLVWLKGAPKAQKISVPDIRERIIIDCGFAVEYSESIVRLLDVDITDEDLVSERIASIISELNVAYNNILIEETVSTAHRRIKFSNETVDFITIAKDLEERIREVEAGQSRFHEGFGGEVNFDDEASIEKTFEAAKESLSTEGVLKTGLDGLNRMWGIGGYIRGGSYLYGACTHNYKTGILLDHCRWFTMHNTPHLLDKKKTPMILRISFENKPEQDLPILYRSLWEAEHGKKCDIQTVSSREAAKYIKDKMTSNGFTFKMLCFDPNNMDVWDVITILQGYEAEGYEIHGVIIDYLELITKKQDSRIPRRQDEVINLTYEILRNHCFPRGITQINAHQLSTQALEIAREGTSNFAKKIAPGHFWQNSKSLATKVDGACIMHIHKLGDDAFLTFAWAKNRTSSDTPESRKAFAYKFEEFGGINDDLDSGECAAIYSWASVTDPTEDTAPESEEAW